MYSYLRSLTAIAERHPGSPVRSIFGSGWDGEGGFDSPEPREKHGRTQHRRMVPAAASRGFMHDRQEEIRENGGGGLKEKSEGLGLPHQKRSDTRLPVVKPPQGPGEHE